MFLKFWKRQIGKNYLNKMLNKINSIRVCDYRFVSSNLCVKFIFKTLSSVTSLFQFFSLTTVDVNVCKKKDCEIKHFCSMFTLYVVIFKHSVKHQNYAK